MRVDADVNVSGIEAVPLRVRHGNEEGNNSEHKDNESNYEKSSHESSKSAVNNRHVAADALARQAERRSAALASLARPTRTRAPSLRVQLLSDNYFPNSRANSTKLLTAIPDGPFAIQGLLSSIHAV